MTEFWESSFKDKQTMWGFEPADPAVATAELFGKQGLKKVLIPGFGYGRNAKVFIDNGIEVTGIEISETAIELAAKQYGEGLQVYHGSVDAMPYDKEVYDGVFCYALIHLLDEKARAKLIADCYEHLRPGGYMVFVSLSTSDNTYAKGEPLSKDRFLSKHGVQLFYYDSDSLSSEFGKYGLLEAREIAEPAKNVGEKPTQKFWQVICKREQ